MNKDDVTITYTNDDGTSGSYVVPGDQWEVTYDSQGRRISKEYHKAPVLHNPNFPVALVCQIDESYDYVGDQLVAIRDHMGANESIITFTYDMFGPATLTYNGTTYYYLRNAQGDIMGISDEEGNQLVAYTYDAWGKPLSITGTMATTLGEANPFRYRGYFYDDETGLYYLQSRYYDPVVGRLVTADTTDILIATPMALTDKNLFAYCDNNPVMRADYGGDFWHIAIGAVVGGLIGGVVKAVSNVIAGKDITDGLGTAILAGAASGALASTGVGLVGMMVGNAAISMAENATNQVIANKGFNNFDVGDMVTDGFIGGVSGAIGGAGKGSELLANPKHLTTLGMQTVKRTINATANKGINAGLKEAGKAFAYYGKNTGKYYKSFFRGLFGDIFSTVGTTIASSNYMKYQYQRLMWR